MFYWSTKTFKSFAAMSEWMDKNKSKYQMRQIFINNGYAVEYKDLIKI